MHLSSLLFQAQVNTYRYLFADSGVTNRSADCGRLIQVNIDGQLKGVLSSIEDASSDKWGTQISRFVSRQNATMSEPSHVHGQGLTN